MKVYGWTSYKQGHRGARVIMAAESKVEVARLMGERAPSGLMNLSETHRANEHEVARAKPRTPFVTFDPTASADATWEELPVKKKTAPKKDEFQCEACGYIGGTWSRYRFELADGAHDLCAGRGRCDAKQSCKDTLLAKLRVCPGCGERDKVAPGFLCAGCKDRLHLADEMPKSLEWWTIARFEAFADLGDWQLSREITGDSASDAREHFASLIAQACTLGRYESHNRHKAEDRIIAPESTKPKKGWDNDVSGPQLETTPARAKHIADLVTFVANLCEAQRLRGRAEGRSLLAGLASGELTANEWSKKDAALVPEAKALHFRIAGEDDQ